MAGVWGPSPASRWPEAPAVMVAGVGCGGHQRRGRRRSEEKRKEKKKWRERKEKEKKKKRRECDRDGDGRELNEGVSPTWGSGLRLVGEKKEKKERKERLEKNNNIIIWSRKIDYSRKIPKNTRR